MVYLWQGLREAFQIIFSLDGEFLAIVWVSCKVSLISTFVASAAAVPAGIWMVHHEFRGKALLLMIFRTLMSLPTVVVGLMVYAFLSRRGPLGDMGLLFTQTAIVIGQVMLIFPLITALTISSVQGLDPRIMSTARSLGADSRQAFFCFFREARYALTGAVIAGFGRVFAEVGISMMLGGNIRFYTRTITTAIALETSKGEFALGIALGLVLLTVAFGLNLMLQLAQSAVRR